MRATSYRAAMGLTIVLFAVGVLLQYVVVRLAVTHAVQAVLRRDLQAAPPSANPYGGGTRGPGGAQI